MVSGCRLVLGGLGLSGHVSHWVKVGVRHGFLAGHPILVVVAQQLVQKVQRLGRDEVRVLAADELGPLLARVPPHERLQVRVQLDAVLVEVHKQVVCAQHLGDLHQLIVVVMAVEKGLLPEDHAGKHAAEGPEVQRVIIVLQVHQQLRPLEVPGRHAHVVLGARVVKLRQAPVNEPQFPLLMVDHHIVWLHIPVHDAQRMAVVQRLEQLQDVVPHVVVGEGGVEDLEVGVVHVLEDEAGRLGLLVPHHVEQLDDVGAAVEVLQDLHFSLDLLLLHRLKDLYDAARVVHDVDALEDLAVLTASHLLYHLIVVLAPPLHVELLVVPVVPGLVNVRVRVDAGPADHGVLAA
mmetsp:Transcript_8091/g.20738  ORF Transcript_8091/g.20738 Transcript_8091/m.20738 type:complete len:348 (-) Transcript_8091:212-1255(-)